MQILEQDERLFIEDVLFNAILSNGQDEMELRFLSIDFIELNEYDIYLKGKYQSLNNLTNSISLKDSQMAEDYVDTIKLILSEIPWIDSEVTIIKI